MKEYSKQASLLNGRVSNGFHTQQARNSSDEIDLLEVMSLIVRLIKRYHRMLVVFAVAGIVAGYLWLLLAPPHYESTLTLKLRGLEKSAVSEILSSFKNNRELLQELSALKEITLADNASAETFVVQVATSDLAILPRLQEKVVNSLEENPYLKAVMDSEKQKMISTINTLKAEEQRLASVIEQTAMESSIHGDRIYSVADLAKLKMDFYKERLVLETQLTNFAAVQVIQPFTKGRPVNKNIILHLLAGTIILLFAAIGLVAVKELSKVPRANVPEVSFEKPNSVLKKYSNGH